MSTSALAKTGLYLSKHSPVILTGVATVGVIATTIVAVKTTATVIDEIRDEEAQRQQRLEPKEVVQMYWTRYIPVASIAATTIAAVLGANAVNTKRNAVLASAFALTNNAFTEYKHQVIETFGEKEEKKVHAELAQKHVDAIPPSKETIIIAGAGDSLFRDDLSDRYFTTNIEEIRKAVNDINFKINNDGYASMNEFYELIGLNTTSLGEELGWRLDNKLEVEFYPVMSTDSRPCIELRYPNSPNREYYRFG